MSDVGERSPESPATGATRRRLLAALALCASGSLAGCGGRGEETPDPTAGPDGRASPSTTRGGDDAGESASGDGREGTPGADGEGREFLPLPGPRGIVVSNPDPTARFTTVAVEDARGETVFVESESVPGDAALAYPEVVSESGAYRVVVETADGVVAEATWRVEGPLGDLRVTLGPTIEVVTTARCVPDCPPVSVGGEAVGFPDGGFDPRGRRAGVELRLGNRTAGDRRIRVRLGEGGGLFDYRYDVPPGVEAVVPVPQRSGETRLAVDARDLDASGSRTTPSTGSLAYDWAMESSPKLTVRVDPETTGSESSDRTGGGAGTERVTVACGPRAHDVRLRNDGDATRSVRLRVTTPDGRVVDDEAYEVAGESTRLVEDVVRTAGTYRVRGTVVGGRGATDAGESLTTTWETCPPRGPLSVVVASDGGLRVEPRE